MRVCGAGARECWCGRSRCRPRKLLGGERTKHTCHMWPDSRCTNRKRCKCNNHACALMCRCMHTPRCTTVTQPCRKLHQAGNERQPTTLHQCAAEAVDPASTPYPELQLIVTALGVAAGAARSRAPVVWSARWHAPASCCGLNRPWPFKHGPRDVATTCMRLLRHGQSYHSRWHHRMWRLGRAACARRAVRERCDSRSRTM